MSLPLYQKIKHSGIDYLGTVPIEWTLKRLGDVVEFAQGKAHEPYIDDDGEYICVNSRFVSTAGRTTKKCNVNLTPASLNDILMVMSDLPNGRALARAYYVQDQAKYAVNQRVCRITAKEAYSRFLFYLLDRHSGLMQNDDGVNQTHLSNADFQKLKLYLPSISEQTQIARFLDHETARIDALIEKQQRLVELLKEKRQAIISHVVTKGLNPNVPMKDSGIEWLGEVPAHWEVRPLRYFIDYAEGPGILAVDFHDEGVPLLRVSCVQGRWATLDGCNYLDPSLANTRWNHFKVREGDLLISASASMGSVCEVGAEVVGAIPYTGLIRLRAIKNFSVESFIRAFVVSSVFSQQVDVLKAGATIQHFGPTHLSQMRLACPPIREQIDIAHYIDEVSEKFDCLVAEAEKGIALLMERRSALISAAVTGKIDVRQYKAKEVA